MSIQTHAASMTFENIRFTYPGSKQETIKGVHIEILQKELVVFVGPSGCGKSTLLRISSGLLFPEKGKLLIDGNDTVWLPPEKRNIGWVPQSYALFEHLSIFDNVGFGLKMAKVPKKEKDKRIYDMLKLCRIEDLAHRSVRALSGGQRQRVAIARALATNPRVLLLDEPLAALDPQLRLAIREDLELLLRESGVTTLFVTHDQSEALALADKIVVLREGVVEQIGSPEDLWNAPCNDFVAEFIGNATIVSANSIGKRTAEIVPGLTCRTNKDILPGQELHLALRNDDLLLSDGGIDAVVTYSEYNGGIYHMKAEVMQNVIVPVSSLIEVSIGKSVKIAVQPHQEITVVGR